MTILIIVAPFMLVIALLCLFILNGNRSVEKRKRKNEELIIEASD